MVDIDREQIIKYIKFKKTSLIPLDMADKIENI